MEVCTMYVANPARPLSWLAADDAVNAVEVLAVIGVLLWAGGLVWLVVADVLRALSESDESGKAEEHGGLRRRFHRPLR
jgi:hypothetical protein